MFKPLEKKRYSEQIADLIQERILKDRMEIGTLLPTEKDLAEEFQVSRAVIRESLRILEISGLVDIKKGPTGGIFVTDGYGRPIKKSLSNMITSGEVTLDHLFDVRLLIEPHIAADAAHHAKDIHLRNLRDLISESNDHLDDVTLLKKNNIRFHFLLGEASGNPILSTLQESLLKLLVELSLDFLNLDLERHFLEVHREILAAVEKGMDRKADRLMRADILDVKAKIQGFRQKKALALRPIVVTHIIIIGGGGDGI